MSEEIRNLRKYCIEQAQKTHYPGNYKEVMGLAEEYYKFVTVKDRYNER